MAPGTCWRLQAPTLILLSISPPPPINTLSRRASELPAPAQQPLHTFGLTYLLKTQHSTLVRDPPYQPVLGVSQACCMREVVVRPGTFHITLTT
jgi:hypothetical protein